MIVVVVVVSCAVVVPVPVVVSTGGGRRECGHRAVGSLVVVASLPMGGVPVSGGRERVREWRVSRRRGSLLSVSYRPAPGNKKRAFPLPKHGRAEETSVVVLAVIVVVVVVFISPRGNYKRPNAHSEWAGGG